MKDKTRKGEGKREGDQKKEEAGEWSKNKKQGENESEKWLGAYNKNSLSLSARDITNHLCDTEAYANSSEIINLSLIYLYTPQQRHKLSVVDKRSTTKHC